MQPESTDARPGLRLTVVIPVFNERETLRLILERVRATPFNKEIILVDDCSRDGTRDLLKEMEKEPDLRIFYHSVNQGKGWDPLESTCRHASLSIL